MPVAQPVEVLSTIIPGSRHHGGAGGRGAPRPSRLAFPGDTVVGVEWAAYVPLHIALVGIVDEEFAMLVEQQRFW